MSKIIKFLKDESGATSVEYALMYTLIALVVVGGAAMLGLAVKAMFGKDTGAW